MKTSDEFLEELKKWLNGWLCVGPALSSRDLGTLQMAENVLSQINKFQAEQK
jgi:hypothetical protein